MKNWNVIEITVGIVVPIFKSLLINFSAEDSNGFMENNNVIFGKKMVSSFLFQNANDIIWLTPVLLSHFL